jgi:outer membrane protein assembly factor BamB
MRARALLLGIGATFFVSLLMAADWPQWRGPQRNGISKETGLLKEWPAGGPKLLWQVKDLGGGYSTPAIVGNRLYVMANEGMQDEFVICLDVNNGQRVWKVRIGDVGPNPMGNNYFGARSTPTVDGNLLYALGSNGHLACLETASGNTRWQKNLRTDFGGKPGRWAYAESPLIDGDVLACTPGGPQATLVALNKQTGDLIWTSPIPEGDEAAYASIIIVQAGGIKQYVQFLQKGIVGVDAKTGKPLWRYDKTATGSPANIPTPVARDVRVYSASGRAGGALVELKAAQGAVEAVEVYAGGHLPSAIGGAIELDGHLYGTNSQGLRCVDFATGSIKWQERGVGAGSLCFADGRLYVHGEGNGEVALVEATPEAYREKGRFTPPDRPTERGQPAGRSWAYPVVANGRLYIRDLTSLWCYDVKGTGGSK